MRILFTLAGVNDGVATLRFLGMDRRLRAITATLLEKPVREKALFCGISSFQHIALGHGVGVIDPHGN